MIFHLHIPKTGGSTMVDLLGRQYGPALYRTPHRILANQPLLYPLEREIGQYRCVSGHFAYGLHERWEIAEPVYLTTVRDPVDRLLSLYHYLKERPAGHKYRDEIAAMKFEEFALSERTDWTFLDNDMVRRISGMGHAERQVTDADLVQAREHIAAHFISIGITDRFDEAARRWAVRLGWQEVRYQHRLAQPDRLQRAQLSPALIARIRARQQYDQALYELALSQEGRDG